MGGVPTGQDPAGAGRGAAADAVPGAGQGVADRPLASFLVVAYNQERVVRAAIEGAFAQTYAPLEIVLSDDASPDGTFAVMEAMAAEYRGPHRIVLNRNPRNLGIPGHVDRLMELSSGAFVVQNAGDDVSVPHRTERLVETWRASGGRVKAVHSAKRWMDADGRLHGLVPSPEPLHRHSPRALLARPPAIHGASMGWARELFDVFGPLGPLPVLEDYPICLRAATLGEMVWIDEPLVHYRMGGLSWADAQPAGEFALYGHRLKRLAWHLSFARAYAEDMKRVEPPEAEACRALVARNLRNFEMELGLAAMGPRERLAALPGALAASLRHRDPAPARMAAKYLLDRAYIAWVNRRGVISRV